MTGRSKYNVQKLDMQGKPICADITCGLSLEGFDITKKERFCRKCRIVHKVLRWQCAGCGKILNESEYNPSRLFCNTCLDKGE